MSDKPYIRNPNDLGGSKWVSAQDKEDYEQELLIKQWLDAEAGSGAIELKHITSKGTARNTLVRADVRLDSQVFDDSARTYADIIAGCDGRDLEDGRDVNEDEISRTSEERLDDELELFCDAIGVKERTKQWVKKSVKSTESLKNLRSLMNDEMPFEISLIDLELSEL